MSVRPNLSLYPYLFSLSLSHPLPPSENNSHPRPTPEGLCGSPRIPARGRLTRYYPVSEGLSPGRSAPVGWRRDRHPTARRKTAASLSYFNR